MKDFNILKKEILSYFLKRKILVSPDFLSSLNQEEDIESLYKLINAADGKNKPLLMSNDAKEILNHAKEINWAEFEKAKAEFEKGRSKKTYEQFVDFINKEKLESDSKEKNRMNEEERKVKIIISYPEDSKKREVNDFVAYFNNRYNAIEKMLRNRQELSELISINRVINKKDRSALSVIGIVKNLQTTENGNILLELEDTTGSIKALINKNKPELFEKAKNIVCDEVIGVSGVNGDKIIFVNNYIFPDVPVQQELKKCPEEVYAVFLSDIHVGSTMFLHENFEHFLKWINGEAGNDAQKEIALKTKYIFIVGDLVDGCGVYPEQDEELIIKDIYLQYEECAKLLKRIPERISVIVCPGNHDAIRISEPQPALYKDLAKPLWEISNIFMVSNPSLVNIYSSEGFPGFDVLLYHGYSFDYYVANVESIRNNGGYNRADLIMRFLLQKRHLAPTHSSTLYIPETTKDPLVIERVPDFFITGHIHKASAQNYRNVTMICGSCWQSKTPFQEKVGHNPEPARVPIVNLQTRKVKILKF